MASAGLAFNLQSVSQPYSSDEWAFALAVALLALPFFSRLRFWPLVAVAAALLIFFYAVLFVALWLA